MFESIWEDIKNQFHSGNMVIRIILVNLAFFISIIVLKLGFSMVLDFDFSGKTYLTYVAPFLELSSSFLKTVTRPWVLFTHMFIHYGLFHLGFNMLILYWFGRIVGDLIGDKKVLPIYLLSGLLSAFLLMLVAALPTPFSIGSSAIGASGAVLGLVMAAAVISPDYGIRLILFGNVRLKYIALTVILMQLTYLVADQNSGGSFGHLGGIIMGYIFITQLRKGNDMSIPVNNVLDWFKNLFSKESRPKPKVAYRNPSLKKKKPIEKVFRGNQQSDISHEQKLDSILDKIKNKGMDSLSEEEKEFLLNASRK